MQPYFAAAADLIDRYEIGVHDTARTAAIMSRKGWIREPDGFWTKDGEVFSLVIDIFAHFQDLTPVLVAQLQAAGFDASFRMTSDYISRMAQGEASAFMFGNLSSMRDPYQVLSHYHSRFARPTGETAEHYWRWQNADFDSLVDRMAQTPNDAPEMMAIYRQAMAIWVGRVTSDSNCAVAAPDSGQRDVLDGMAFGGESLHEHFVLGAVLAVSAAQSAPRWITRCPPYSTAPCCPRP